MHDTKHKQIPNENQWSKLTTVIFSILGLLLILFYTETIPTDYNIFFFILVIVTGFYWIMEKKVWKAYLEKNEKGEYIRPWWLSWTSEIFLIVLSIFLLRGVVGEFFKIPTGSMIPNIMIGEVVVTNKMYYDIKLPIIDKKIVSISSVKRGDIVVFKYPLNKSVNYVKRFIGLPGDVIEYNHEKKTLTINNQEVSQKTIANIKAANTEINELEENIVGYKHRLWIDPNRITIPSFIDKDKNNKIYSFCESSIEKIVCKVPAGHYFALGDNRDNSIDSRFWGFVPHENIIGKAQFIIFSPVELKRIGAIE